MPETGGSPAIRLRIIAVAAVMAALAVPLYLATPGQDVPGSPVVFPWWALAAAFVLTELFVINFHVRRDAHSISLGEIPFMLGLAMASPMALLVGRIVGASVVLIGHRRQAIHKFIFNQGIFLLDTAVAVSVYRLLLSGRSQVSPAGLGAGFVALLAALVVGVSAVAVAVWLTQPQVAFRTVIQSLGAGTVIGVLSSALAVGGLFLAWQDPLALIGVAILAGGVYAVLRVYGALGKRYGDLEAMYSFTSEIDGAVATEELIEVTLTQTRDFFGAGFTEAVLSRGVGSTAVSLGEEGIRRRPAPPSLVSGLAGVLPEGESVISVLMDDGPPEVVAHYSEQGMTGGMLAILGGGAGTATLLTVGPRSDGLKFTPDDLRLLDAIGRHARVSFERGRLVDRLRREIGQKEHQAVHDALTGLPNRLHFTIVVEEALRRARDVDRRVAVLLIDLDRFKEVNDTLGHQRGDALLQEMALRLSDTLGGEEHVARLGGDEFGVLLRDLEGVNEAIEWARKIGSALHRPFVNEGLPIQVSGSLGIALAPDHGTDGNTLLRRADVAMYEAKAHGSSFEVYDQQTDKYSTRRLAMAAELRSAIETDEVRLAYQPKAEIESRTIIGVEALARWRHPRHGQVPPDEFVELAERTGLIGPLTEHVLRTALRDIGRLGDAGIGMHVSVNIAASSLADEEFPGVVARLLDEYDVSPQSLILEVTETTMMTDSARARLVLGAIADLGVGLSIDDYGTGYSSLTYIASLPAHEVKIDRSFVTDMAIDERLANIVSSTTALVHSLGKKVVAEGVENAATWSLLSDAGCDIVQGYYLARPMFFPELRAWLDGGAIPEGDVAARVTPGVALD
jgi:diguanylate cyclase (GGDEF)-like protein